MSSETWLLSDEVMEMFNENSGIISRRMYL